MPRRLTARQNLIAALEGQVPERIPYDVIDQFVDDDPAWNGLFERGLARVSYVNTVEDSWNESVKMTTSDEPWAGGRQAQRWTIETPVGSVSQVSLGDWVQKYFLEKPEDYPVVEYLVRHTRLKNAYGTFAAEEEKLGETGLTVVDIGRSPMQVILVDYAGLENFCSHIMEGFPELFSLADALMEQFVRRCEMAAAGPGRYVRMLENLTADAWGPVRFAKHHIPVYEKVLPILHGGGKKVYPHYDGHLACLAGLLARSKIDGIDSLTPPPEGDLVYEAARKAMPDKYFWAHLNVTLYEMPPDRLARRVTELARAGSPDGRLFGFAICEDLPRLWKEKIPVVLDAIDKL